MCACEPDFTCARCLERERDDERDPEPDRSYSRPGTADVFTIRYFFVYE